jgi:hypothetical protein
MWIWSIFLTLGAQSPEDERMPLQPEASLQVDGERGGRRRLVRQVHDKVAVPADEVAVVPRFNIVAGHLVQGIYLDNQPLLAKHLQGLLHRIEGNSRHMRPNFLVNLLGGRMIPAALQIPQHR